MFAPSDPTVAAGMAILVHYMFHVRNIKFPQAPSSRIRFVDTMMEAGVASFVATHMRYSDHDLYRLSWVVMLTHSGTLVFEVTA